MIKLVKGTKENLGIDVVDKLGDLTTLDGTNPTFDVRLRDAASWIHQNAATTHDVMRLFCLIDTTEAAYVEGTYELFIKFNNLPEIPRLGPHVFEVAYA